MMKNFSYEIDSDGIAVFTFDVPGRTMNTFTFEAVAELGDIARILRDEDAIKGAVFVSGKSNAFCAGADLGDMAEMAGGGATGAARLAGCQKIGRMTRLLREIETVGKPIAAALEGLALGAGLEFVLATHFRVASAGVKVGLPESTIGLLPGAGGTQRALRLCGFKAAHKLISSGKHIDAQHAVAINLLNELAEPGQVVARAKAWVKANPDSMQPWDQKGFAMPDGAYTLAGSMDFMVAAAEVRKKYQGNYPAQENILRCLYEGYTLPIDMALETEVRLMVSAHQQAQARSMIRTNFISKQALAKGGSRPAGVPKFDISKITVLGAGMMGAGIAFVQALAGVETVLIDVSKEAAERGKDYSRGILEKKVGKGSITQEAADKILDRIIATDDYDLIKGSDLIVEAVFEDRALKADVTKRAEAQLEPHAVFGSNTSTLPISQLAEVSERPANFIGLHFFSPVDRMELVEIILGDKTAPETLAKALDYCRLIKKVPIVVNDSRGFYTSRVFETYLTEGMEMLIEGINPVIIDNVGRMIGMPRGPLELCDDVAIDLVNRIFRQRRLDFGLPDPASGTTDRVLADMVDADRLGRKNGKGFYDYQSGQGKTLWSGLAERYPVTAQNSSPELVEHLKMRLLYRQAIEAARCMDESVVTAPEHLDVGAVLGWSFANWTGGPASMIDSIGVPTFNQNCRILEQRYGARFKLPAMLEKMEQKGTSFYPNPASFLDAAE